MDHGLLVEPLPLLHRKAVCFDCIHANIYLMKSLQYCDRQEIWQAMRNSIDVNTMGRFKYEYNCIASIDNAAYSDAPYYFSVHGPETREQLWQ